jgi:hypothetical protein
MVLDFGTRCLEGTLYLKVLRAAGIAPTLLERRQRCAGAGGPFRFGVCRFTREGHAKLDPHRITWGGRRFGQRGCAFSRALRLKVQPASTPSLAA